MMVDTATRNRVGGEIALSGVRPSECGSRSAPRWHVVQTHPGAEPLAVTELANQHIASLLPLRIHEPEPDAPNAPRRHRKRSTLPRFGPAFPGYIFALFDVGADRWRSIHSTRGVKRLFSYDPERPIPVPIGVVERIMANLSRNLIPVVSRHMPRPNAAPIPLGAIVTLIAEPFARQDAICIRSDDRGGCIRVQMLATGWEVEVSRDAVVAL